MAIAVFIGDELSAIGYALAGLDIRVPETGQAQLALTAALAEHSLILLSVQRAREIEPSVLEDYMSRVEPLLLVVPELAGDDVEDLSESMCRALGVEL